MQGCLVLALLGASRVVAAAPSPVQIDSWQADPPRPVVMVPPMPPAPPGLVGLRPRQAPEPPYDPAERAAGHRGNVRVAMQVGADGRVVDARIEKGSGWPVLDAQALATVRTWTYDPSTDAAAGPRPTWATLVFDGRQDRPEALVRATTLDCRAWLDRVARSGYPDAKAAAVQQPEFDSAYAEALKRTTQPRGPGEFLKVLHAREALYLDLVARCEKSPRRPVLLAFDDAMVALLGY